MGLLLHYWRLLTEPSGKDRLRGFGPKRWRVRYKPCELDPKGGLSEAMAYDVACDYAAIFNGTVERAK